MNWLPRESLKARLYLKPSLRHRCVSSVSEQKGTSLSDGRQPVILHPLSISVDLSSEGVDWQVVCLLEELIRVQRKVLRTTWRAEMNISDVCASNRALE